MPFASHLDIVAALALGLVIAAFLTPNTNTRRTMDTVVPVVPGSPPIPDPSERSEAHETSHEPSIADVLVVKAMLTRALALPVEIVDAITDLAEYWPHSTVQASWQHNMASHRCENLFLVSPAFLLCLTPAFVPYLAIDSLTSASHPPAWPPRLGPRLAWGREHPPQHHNSRPTTPL